MKKHTDSLTGLPDRSSLERLLETHILEEKPIALALLDVDYFMSINEQYGRDKGDHVLQTLSRFISETFADHVFRISGDEFAVALPGSSLEQAFLRMEGLRSRVEQDQSPFELPEQHKISVTIGVAQYPRDAKDVMALNKAADAAQMAAKELGRNQVSLPPNEEMVMKSCYYASTSIRRLKLLAEKTGKKESILLREALNDLLHKYDQKLSDK